MFRGTRASCIRNNVARGVRLCSKGPRALVYYTRTAMSMQTFDVVFSDKTLTWQGLGDDAGRAGWGASGAPAGCSGGPAAWRARDAEKAGA